jgi:hypothetical protein
MQWLDTLRSSVLALPDLAKFAVGPAFRRARGAPGCKRKGRGIVKTRRPPFNPQHRSTITCIDTSSLPGGDRDAAGTIETLPRVLPVPRGDKEWYLCAARAGLSNGVASHRGAFGSTRTAVVRLDRPARHATIFIHNGAPQVLLGSLGRANVFGSLAAIPAIPLAGSPAQFTRSAACALPGIPRP